MNNLIDLNFWFNLVPVRMSPVFEIGFFAVFLLMIMAGLAFRIMKKNKTDKFDRISLEKATAIMFWVGGLGLMWLFFSFEEISIFAARFWVLILGVIFAVTTYKLYQYRQITVPQLRMLEQSKAEANKYLPRRR
jgi:amino acid transporter